MSVDRPPRLLVLACSATKRPDPGRIPALARYDGPLWRTLRATDPDGRMARVAVLSARYGFRDAATPIADYDARLTPDLAARMIAGGVTTRWPRPPTARRPDTFGVHAGAEIAGLTHYGDEPIVDVALVGGRLSGAGPTSPSRRARSSSRRSRLAGSPRWRCWRGISGRSASTPLARSPTTGSRSSSSSMR